MNELTTSEKEALRAMVRRLPCVDVSAACMEIVSTAAERIHAIKPQGEKEPDDLYLKRVRRQTECISNLANIAQVQISQILRMAA